MKFLFILILLLAFTSCTAGLGGITPSGIPQHPVEDLDGVDYEAEPILVPEGTGLVASPHRNVLRLSMRRPVTLNPLLNEDVTVAQVLRLMFEPLVVLDEELRPSGHLAELEFASDFSAAYLTVRDWARWSDGELITADDIVFSVNTLRAAPAGAIYQPLLQNIAQVTQLTSRSVRVSFHEPSVIAGYSLGFPIIPRHFFEGHNAGSYRNMQPVGSGAFMFHSMQPMRLLTLVQNPHSHHQAQVGQVDVIFLPDRQTEFYAFDHGRIDALHLPFTEWVGRHGVRQVRHENIPAMYFEFIGFNFENEFFRSSTTRQAIAHSFNADEAVPAVYLAQAVRAAAPIHPLSWACSGVPGPAFDPARAAALLGYNRPEDTLVILANQESFQRVNIAHRLSESLNAIGLPATVRTVPMEDYIWQLENGWFDIYIGTVILSFAPSLHFLFQSGGMFRYDPILEEAFHGMMAATSEAAYKQAVYNFSQTFMERLPVIGLGFTHSSLLANTRIAPGLHPSPDNVLGGAGHWEIIG
ncbi:MAG: ABC transporter substrate-binding protein [Defluviitaleaceae bacterium]|nr:ABC transporter substrate-binding protein [Defluviitaleaceae bacterium]